MYTNELFLESFSIGSFKESLIEQKDNKIKKITQQLKDGNVETSKLENIAKKYSKRAVVEFKQSKDKADIGIILKRNFQAAVQESSIEVAFNKIGKSLVLLSIILIINTFLHNFLAVVCMIIGLPPSLGYAMGSIFVAPLTEETAKMISIQGGFTGTFFVVFNVAEFSMYMVRLLGAGMDIVTATVARLLAVGLHATTTLIQKYYYDKYPKDENKKYTGYKLGILIHGLWNFMAVMGH
jgi:hypothetical protein